MMALPLLLLAVLPTLQTRTSAQTFEMPLPVAGDALARAQTRAHGAQTVLWIPDAKLPAYSASLQEGPVLKVRVHPARHGVAITLTPRPGAEVRGALALTAGPRPLLRVGPPLADAAGETVPSQPLSWPPEVGAEAPRLSPVGLLVSAALLLLGAAYLALRAMRGPPQMTGGARIDVLAVRSLGGRHRLAVVQTCGERLLVAASDRDITLLSPLGEGLPDTAVPAGSSDVEGILHLRRAERQAPRPDPQGGPDRPPPRRRLEIVR